MYIIFFFLTGKKRLFHVHLREIFSFFFFFNSSLFIFYYFLLLFKFHAIMPTTAHTLLVRAHVCSSCFQLGLTLLRGGPIGGICWVASARNASAMRWGCVWIIPFHPAVSMTSVACLQSEPGARVTYLNTQLNHSLSNKQAAAPQSSKPSTMAHQKLLSTAVKINIEHKISYHMSL